MLRSLQLWSFEAFVVRFFWHFIVKTRDSPNWADIQHAFLISLIHWCHILCYKLRLQDFRLFCFRLTFEIWQKKKRQISACDSLNLNTCLLQECGFQVSGEKIHLGNWWALFAFVLLGTVKRHQKNIQWMIDCCWTWFQCSYISLQLISEEAPWYHSCNIKQFLSWHITTRGA